jgi:hypothetical protein
MYTVYIPFVNNKNCLDDAIKSLGKYKEMITVIDNSDKQDLVLEGIKILKPDVPLFTSQAWNYIAKKCEDDVFMLMHSDATASEKAYEELSKKIEGFKNEKWSIIFTNYDSFCAINRISYNEIGGADTEFLRYFVDNDLYRRFDLAGYKRGNLDVEVKHKGSMTINSDKMKLLVNGITYPMQKVLYIKKWGGEGGNEIYETPFNIKVGK